MEDRGSLAAQLVRCHALLWSVEDAKVKQAIKQRIRAIEARIAALDAGPAPPPPACVPGLRSRFAG